MVLFTRSESSHPRATGVGSLIWTLFVHGLPRFPDSRSQLSPATTISATQSRSSCHTSSGKDSPRSPSLHSLCRPMRSYT